MAKRLRNNLSKRKTLKRKIYKKKNSVRRKTRKLKRKSSKRVRGGFNSGICYKSNHERDLNGIVIDIINEKKYTEYKLHLTLKDDNSTLIRVSIENTMRFSDIKDMISLLYDLPRRINGLRKDNKDFLIDMINDARSEILKGEGNIRIIPRKYNMRKSNCEERINAINKSMEKMEVFFGVLYKLKVYASTSIRKYNGQPYTHINFIEFLREQLPGIPEWNVDNTDFSQRAWAQ
tara:strand:+ start:1269 stop:1967 length:699 start_codon:yes stop_codon:yes gene_type:complete